MPPVPDYHLIADDLGKLFASATITVNATLFGYHSTPYATSVTNCFDTSSGTTTLTTATWAANLFSIIVPSEPNWAEKLISAVAKIEPPRERNLADISWGFP